MVNAWLEGAARHPLLTPAQEIQLGNQIRAWLDVDNPDAKAIRRGKKARERMIQCNLRLVTAVSKKYTSRIKSNSTVSLEDLLQEGSVGLARAVEKFDPETGYKFSTYAYWWIRQAMGRMCDMNSSAVRIPTHVHHTALKWRYRPQGQTLEEFAAGRNEDPAKVKQRLAFWQRAQAISLDVKTKADDEGSDSMLDFIAADQPIEDEQDYAQILDDLKFLDNGVLKDPLAILELAEQYNSREIGELLGCSIPAAGRRIRDCRSQVREHLPSHIRDAIVGPERQITDVKMVEPQPAPVRELVAVGCKAAQSSLMTSSIQPTTNGHSKSLEAEAMEVIETVKAEPAEVQAEPKRRRRTKAEVKAEKDSKAISVVVDGTEYQGQADHIAQLIVAMKAA